MKDLRPNSSFILHPSSFILRESPRASNGDTTRTVRMSSSGWAAAVTTTGSPASRKRDSTTPAHRSSATTGVSSWSGPVTECRVLDRHPDGLPRRVAFTVDMTLKTLRYVLEYTWEPPHGGRWRLVEGDIKDVQGSYRFEPAGKRTKATCGQAIDLGFWVPGPIRRPFEQSVAELDESD